MGACVSCCSSFQRPPTHQHRDLRSESVTLELEEAKAEAEKIHKLLLLGPGNSGKSTLFKQLSRIHGKKLTEEDKAAYRKQIWDSVLEQFKSLIIMAYDDFELELGALEEPAEYILNLAKDTRPSVEVVNRIKTMWADPRIKEVFDNRIFLGVVDSCPFFWDDIDRIADKDYVPTFDDIILCRIPTTGILEHQFYDEEENAFEIYDVGGQRSERHKWIHCFEKVHAVLFVIGLSCYDQKLFEDGVTNAMKEGIDLWEEIVDLPYFKNSRTSLIIFFNKSDLFRLKIKDKPITMAFPDYDGDPNDFDECIDFLRKFFLSLNPVPETERQVYTHVTCATDSNNVEAVFEDIEHNVVVNALISNGIL